MLAKKKYSKTVFTIFLSLFFLFSFSQKQIKIYNQKIENGFEILADNDEIFPVSVTIDFNLINLLNKTLKNIYVIPANTKSKSLTILNVDEVGEKYSFSFKYHSFIGDVTAKPNKNFEYDLPFKKGEQYKLHQGYNGSFSHQNENCLDFTMPIGTQVLAARSGWVIQVVDNYNKTCANRSCMEYNNYITILHDDGTYAKYVHIDFEAAKVAVGDSIKIGQLIALSGNIGFSSGPHLHFEVCQPSMDGKLTLETKFKIEDGTKTSFLQEGKLYSKNY